VRRLDKLLQLLGHTCGHPEEHSPKKVLNLAELLPVPSPFSWNVDTPAFRPADTEGEEEEEVAEEEEELEDVAQPTTPKPELKPEPRPQPTKPEPKPEPRPEPKPEPKPQPAFSEPKRAPKPEPKPEPRPQPTKPEPGTQPTQPEPRPQHLTPEPKPEPRPQPTKHKPGPQPKPKPNREPRPEPKPLGPKPKPKLRLTEPEPKVEPKPEPKSEPERAATSPAPSPATRPSASSALSVQQDVETGHQPLTGPWHLLPSVATWVLPVARGPPSAAPTLVDKGGRGGLSEKRPEDETHSSQDLMAVFEDRVNLFLGFLELPNPPFRDDGSVLKVVRSCVDWADKHREIPPDRKMLVNRLKVLDQLAFALTGFP